MKKITLPLRRPFEGAEIASFKITPLLLEDQKKQNLHSLWVGITDKSTDPKPLKGFLFKTLYKEDKTTIQCDIDIRPLKENDEIVIGFKGLKDSRRKLTVHEIGYKEITFIDYDDVNLTDWAKNINGLPS